MRCEAILVFKLVRSLQFFRDDNLGLFSEEKLGLFGDGKLGFD